MEEEGRGGGEEEGPTKKEGMKKKEPKSTGFCTLRCGPKGTKVRMERTREGTSALSFGLGMWRVCGDNDSQRLTRLRDHNIRVAMLTSSCTSRKSPRPIDVHNRIRSKRVNAWERAA